MKPKTIIALALAIALLVGVAGTAFALSAASFEMPVNNAQGAGAGGGTASSTSFRITTSIAGAVQVSSDGASTAMCTGFLCQFKSVVAKFFNFLPVIVKN